MGEGSGWCGAGRVSATRGSGKECGQPRRQPRSKGHERVPFPRDLGRPPGRVSPGSTTRSSHIQAQWSGVGGRGGGARARTGRALPPLESGLRRFFFRSLALGARGRLFGARPHARPGRAHCDPPRLPPAKVRHSGYWPGCARAPMKHGSCAGTGRSEPDDALSRPQGRSGLSSLSLKPHALPPSHAPARMSVRRSDLDEGIRPSVRGGGWGAGKGGRAPRARRGEGRGGGAGQECYYEQCLSAGTPPLHQREKKMRSMPPVTALTSARGIPPPARAHHPRPNAPSRTCPAHLPSATESQDGERV